MYLSRTALLLRKGEVDLANEPFLLDNVFRETDGLEREIACDKAASKWMETIVKHANQAQLRGLLHRLSLSVGNDDGAFVTMCTDPYCSYVLQSVFVRLGETELAADAPARDSQGVAMLALGDLMLAWLKRLGDDLLGMAHQRVASFVLRQLALLLGNCKETGKNEKLVVTLREGRAAEPWMETGFGRLFDAVVAGLEKSAEDVREACRSAAAAAALQTLLAIADENGKSGKAAYETRRDKLVCVLTFLPAVGSKQVATGETSLFVEMACDVTGSQLMQRVVQRCHRVHFETVWKTFLVSDARRLALDRHANYVVTAAMERVREFAHLDVMPMLEALCKPNLAALFNGNVLKLIVAMLRAAARLEGEPGSLWRRKLVAQLAQSEIPAPLLTQLVGTIGEGGAQVSAVLTEIACVVHEMGQEGPRVVDAFWDGLTEEQVRSACCNRVWSMVAEAFLKGNSARSCKHKFVRKMNAHLVEMARDKYGFHPALTALAFCETEYPETHATLMKQLKQNREYVCRNEWGQKLMKKLAQLRAAADKEQGEDEAVPAPLTVDALLEDRKANKKSKKKAKKRTKKREREEEVEIKQQ